MNREERIARWLDGLDDVDDNDWRETSPDMIDPDVCDCGMCADCDRSDPGVRR